MGRKAPGLGFEPRITRLELVVITVSLTGRNSCRAGSHNALAGRQETFSIGEAQQAPSSQTLARCLLATFSPIEALRLIAPNHILGIVSMSVDCRFVDIF